MRNWFICLAGVGIILVTWTLSHQGEGVFRSRPASTAASDKAVAVVETLASLNPPTVDELPPMPPPLILPDLVRPERIGSSPDRFDKRPVFQDDPLPFPRDVTPEDRPSFVPEPPPASMATPPVVVIPDLPTDVPHPVYKIPEEVLTPVGQLRLAVADLVRLSRQDPTAGAYVKYLSFFTWVDLPGSQDLETARRTFRFEFGHVQGSKTLVREFDVPGSFGTLIRIDIRDSPNWTRAAWEVVGNRDYLFRETGAGGDLPHRETQFLRIVTGVRQDPETLAAVSLLNAYQLYRDIQEPNRQDPKGVKASYYDLLYAAERFPDGDLDFVVTPGELPPPPKLPEVKPWPGGVWPGDGIDYPAGSFTTVRQEDKEAYQRALIDWQARKAAKAEIVPSPGKPRKGIANFPAKGADFEKRWGAAVNDDDLKRLLVDPRFGGIAVGAENDPQGGSYVALNDRAIQIKRTEFGWAARTSDVFENVDEFDHMERILEIAQGKAKAQAGELLATLPNGAQAALLVNGEDDRVEVANSTVAQNRSRSLDKFADVRTHMGCVVCHGASKGFIPFNEALQKSIERGLEGRKNDDRFAQQVRDFYTEWQESVRGLQDFYAHYTKAATKTRNEPEGWTSATAIKQYQIARDWYDLPVGLKVIAREHGVSPRELEEILLNLDPDKIQLRESIKTRVNQIATNQLIPKRAYEVNVSQEIARILDTVRPRDEPLKILIAEDLLADALKRFGEAKVIRK